MASIKDSVMESSNTLCLDDDSKTAEVDKLHSAEADSDSRDGNLASGDSSKLTKSKKRRERKKKLKGFHDKKPADEVETDSTHVQSPESESLQSPESEGAHVDDSKPKPNNNHRKQKKLARGKFRVASTST